MTIPKPLPDRLTSRGVEVSLPISQVVSHLLQWQKDQYQANVLSHSTDDAHIIFIGTTATNAQNRVELILKRWNGTDTYVQIEGEVLPTGAISRRYFSRVRYMMAAVTFFSLLLIDVILGAQQLLGRFVFYGLVSLVVTIVFGALSENFGFVYTRYSKLLWQNELELKNQISELEVSLRQLSEQLPVGLKVSTDIDHALSTTIHEESHLHINK